MAKLSIRIHELIALRLGELYNAIIDEGVPDRLAAILTAPDGDPAALPVESAAA